jgi:hypothetical protein
MTAEAIPRREESGSTLLLVGILFISLSTLLFEITLTRILSLMIWYHFAFMVISVVLLGFGASGAWLSLSRRAKEADPVKFLSFSSGMYALSIVLTFLVVRTLSLDPFRMVAEKMNFLKLFALYALLIIPFFFAGTTIGLAFMRYTSAASRIYFVDLLGASIGCLAMVALIGPAGGPGCVAIAAVIAGVACLMFSLRAGSRGGRVLGVLVLVLAGGGIAMRKDLEIRPCPSKQLAAYLDDLRNGRLEFKFSEWNPISRIDVVGTRQEGLTAKFGLYTASMTYRGPFPNQMFLTIDGDAGTIIHNFDGDFSTVGMLDYSLYPAVYHLTREPRVLIIGLGGGTDILTALKYNASSVTGVEINPSIVKVGMHVMDDFNGGIFNHRKVRVVNDEGRSFIRHSAETYDVIQLTGVDTWSALSSGAYTLSENYLYTVEAFEDFLLHLEEDGVLSVIRFLFNPPRETLRLCSLGMAAMENLGLGRARDHIAVLTNGPFASMLLRKSPLSDEDKKALIDFTRERGLGIVYIPGGRGNNPFYSMLNAGDPAKFMEQYRYDVSPVTDEKPFFYKYYKWANFTLSKEGVGGQIGANFPVGEIVLLALLIQAAVLSLLFIILPLALFERSRLGRTGRGRVLVYFSALGLGFMFLEITVIQRFILFLGSPTYSISVVLFSILFGSCLGSLFSGKLRMEPRRILLAATAAIVIMSLFHIHVVPLLFRSFLGVAQVGRIALSIAAILPLGFVLGIPFPLGLRVLGERNPAMVPWAWGVNGCFSVLGSILCVVISMETGFVTAMQLAILVYVAALLSLRSYLRITITESAVAAET